MITFVPVEPPDYPLTCPRCHGPLSLEVGHDDGPHGDGDLHHWRRCPCGYGIRDDEWHVPEVVAFLTPDIREQQDKAMDTDVGPWARLLAWRLAS